MITFKSVYFTIIAIFLVSFCGKCSSVPFKNVQFITNSEQKSNEDLENELIEPEILEGKLDRTRSGLDENDQAVENKKLITEERKEIKDKFVKEDVGRKRIVRQVNSAYSHIYPTLSPQNPVYPTPYRPATGVHGTVPNNYYANNSNSYSKTGYTQPNYYPQGQNPLPQNASYTNQRYNQTSPYNNQYPTNAPYSQFNQYSNQRYNSSVGQPNHYFNNHPSVNNSNPSFQSNFQQNGYNANRNVFTPTPANQWTPSYTNNNTRYNPTAPKYPNFNNSPNTFNNYHNNSTSRTVINGQNGYNPQYNPSNPPYGTYPLSRNTQQNNYNGSNQWSSSSSQTPYNPGSLNYPSIPSDGRSSNVSPQNYPANNNPYNLQPYSPNSQNYPTGQNGHNSQYNKEPEHFFYSPGSRGRQ